MRKAKVILSAIAIFAIVGGAMAVKASKATRILQPFFYVSVPGDFCTAPTQTSYTTLGVATTVIPYSSAPTFLTTCQVAVRAFN